MSEKNPSMPYSELIREQQKVLGGFVELDKARRTAMAAAGVGGSFTVINRFPGGRVIIQGRGTDVEYAVKIGRGPIIDINLGK